MKMVMNRDITVSTTLGHTIGFKRDVPVNVPPSCIEAVMAKGAIPAEGEELPSLQRKAQIPAPVGMARKAAVFEAYDTMVALNERGTFTAAGVPVLKEVRLKTKFKVDEKENSLLWDEYKALRHQEASQANAGAKVEAKSEEIEETITTTVVTKKVAPKKRAAPKKRKAAPKKRAKAG